MRVLRKTHPAIDGTVKYSVCGDDSSVIEAVFLPNGSSHGLCVSTQVGCNMGCSFCATGLQRSLRNLSYNEIVEQVSLVEGDAQPSTPLGYVTFAGMGEPLANFVNTVRALDEIRARFAPSILSVSTVGLTKQIKRMRDEGRRERLYVSLHGADDETRQRTLPMAVHNPILQLLDAVSAYAENQIFGNAQISYLLLPGVNDSEQQLARLIQILRGRPLVVQILMWNVVPGLNFSRSPDVVALDWVQGLLDAGIPAYAMPSKGSEVGAACGQLAAEQKL